MLFDTPEQTERGAGDETATPHHTPQVLANLSGLETNGAGAPQFLDIIER